MGLIISTKANETLPSDPPKTNILTQFTTQEIDLALAASHSIGPAVPGFGFGIISGHWLITQALGVISTPPTTKAGNDAGGANIMASGSNPTSAHFNLGKNSINNISLAVKPVVMLDLTNQIILAVTLGATGTGGFTFLAKLSLVGVFYPLSP